jgi:hypothetical protein
MRFSFVAQLSKYREHHAFKGMVGTGHPNLSGEVSEVGSVSQVRSTAFPRNPS